MTVHPPLRDSLPLPYRPPKTHAHARAPHHARRLAAVVGTAAMVTGLGMGVGVGVARAETGECVEKWTAQNWSSSEASLICEALYGTTNDGDNPAIDNCVYADRADDVMENVRKYQRNAAALSRSLELAITSSHIARSTCEMNASRSAQTTATSIETRQQDPRKAEYESGYTAQRDHRRMTDLAGMVLVFGAIGAGVFGFAKWRKRRNAPPAHVTTPTPPPWCENHEPNLADVGGREGTADATMDEPSRDQNQGRQPTTGTDGGDDW